MHLLKHIEGHYLLLSREPQFSELQVRCLWQELTKSNTISNGDLRNIGKDKSTLKINLLNLIMFKKHF